MFPKKIFSLKKKENQEVYRLAFTFFGIPVFKINKKYRQKTTKFYVLGLPVFKIKDKGIFRRFYLFNIYIWKRNLFKNIPIPQEERLILFFDYLENDKDAISVDSWTFFEWLREKGVPSKYVVCKNNTAMFQSAKQSRFSKDIIMLDNCQDFVRICHDDICKSNFILTSFGCGPFDETLMQIPYLKHIFIDHGVALLKENVTGLSLYNEGKFNHRLVPTRLTAELYQQKQVWQGRQITVGLPRWDKLRPVSHPSRNIFISFTWRRNLKENLLALRNYQKQIFEFLTDQKFTELLSKYNVNINIALHHALIQQGESIEIPPMINLISSEDIAEIKGQTDLFITDYSSLMFDFMFLDIPVISYRFDADCPYLDESDKIDAVSAKSHDSELYNIFYNKENAVKKIEYYITHNFELEESYKKINASLWWEKENICEHLYEKIKDL